MSTEAQVAEAINSNSLTTPCPHPVVAGQKRCSTCGGTVPDGPVYTDPDRVVKMVKESDYPKPHQLPADGYGNKIPTSYRVLYDNGRTSNARHWHRVYVICYSNSGSAYILVRGQRMFIDTVTEHQLLEL